MNTRSELNLFIGRGLAALKKKKKAHCVSINAENAFGKVEHPFLILKKLFQKIRERWNFPNLVKNIHKIYPANITLNCED